MKKLLAILVSVMFILGTCMSIGASVNTVDDTSVEGQKITCVDMLDFTEANNKWATYNEETKKWEANSNEDDCFNEDGDQCAAIWYGDSKQGNGKYTSERLSWSLTSNGEVLSVEAISTSTAPGIAFDLDYWVTGIKAGKETSGGAEYMKIRIRNYSSAQQFTIGFMTTNINGGLSFYTSTITDVKIASNSGEWAEYIVSIPDENSNTNYQDQLTKNEDGVPNSRYAANLTKFFLFPFGYGQTDGTGAYQGAKMDIDYVVIGSKQYVTDYKSELQQKEDSVSKIEIQKLPDKLAYYCGETIDLEGIEILATYKDGTTEVIDSCDVGYNFEEPGKKTISLKYGVGTASYEVEVTGITSIEIATLPESLTYTKSSITKDGFAPSDLKIKVNYSDGESAEIGVNAVKLVYDFSTVGDKKVTVNYLGYTVQFDVTIIDIVSIQAEDLEKVYFGQELTESDLTISCVYSDESVKTLSDAAISPKVELEYEIKAPGVIDVVVHVSNETYGIDCTTTIKATVATPTSLDIDLKNAVLSVDVDATYDPSTLKVNYVYEDGHKSVLTPDDFKLRYDFGQPGTTPVTVTDNYAGISASFDVEVKGMDVTTKKDTTETTAKSETTTKPSTPPSGESGSPVVIIIIIVAVVVVAAVVVVVIIMKKKKK
ncbi:MAG: bacterial Ig-like domain-containing protein [Clostridiales bacterium]|nr:bacterial Ig-like domain-containing protein [Clostridiales bacterium]